MKPPRTANLIVIFVALGIFALSAFLTFKVILPGYVRPTNRTYTSRLGYLAFLRRTGQPFPIKTAVAVERNVVEVEMGEGLMACQPVIASALALGRIRAVHVREGDVVQHGQLLAEIDDSQANLHLQRAQLALKSAEAQLARVKAGSILALSHERPERDTINLDFNTKEIDIWREQNEANKKLFSDGAVSRIGYLESEVRLLEAERHLQTSTLSLGASSVGEGESIFIAENQIAVAKATVEERQTELHDCQILAPADGIIERMLVQPGEYNGSIGRSAFVIDSGLWFEAHLDQKAMQKVQIGDSVEVELQGASKPLSGRVRHIIGVVSYGAGGPETSRPIRPIGTGAPEWPTTFRVQVELAPSGGVRLAPGMTGFARVRMERSAITIPESAIVSISAGSGLVHVLESAQRTLRPVKIGTSWQNWREITEGLRLGERVICEGHEDLEEGDPVRETPAGLAKTR